MKAITLRGPSEPSLLLKKPPLAPSPFLGVLKCSRVAGSCGGPAAAPAAAAAVLLLLCIGVSRMMVFWWCVNMLPVLNFCGVQQMIHGIGKQAEQHA
jgi:hypothetical protein